MGLHLDWEIEADQSTVKGHKEDQKSARARRMARLRILLTILFVVGLIGSVYGLVYWRLQMVNNEIERALVDTVMAEVTMLRIADRNGFLNIQRSASEEWIQAQSEIFNAYQRLKTEQNLQLTGNVIQVEVDNARGRVQVEEIINGVPYVRTWFYWRYADEGWRHVPPDYTFWGDPATIERPYVTVQYQELDHPVAVAVADEVNNWIDFTCRVVSCEAIPTLSVNITPETSLNTVTETTPWAVLMPSPYIGLARLDRPFDDTVRLNLATLVAERLLTQTMSTVQTIYPADAYYIREAVHDWLIGQYTGRDTASHLIASYANRYDIEGVGGVIANMTPGADIRILNTPAQVAQINELAVDWRDYLTWRLNLEVQLHNTRDEANYIGLYDTRLPEVANLAFQRLNEPVSEGVFEVLSVQPEIQPDGVPGLVAVTQITDPDGSIRQETVLFRLSDGVWKRAN